MHEEQPVVVLPDLAHRALTRMLATGDVVGHDAAGRIVITLAVEEWMFDWLMSYDAEGEDAEDDDGV